MSQKILDTAAYPTKATPAAADLVVLGDSANLTGGVQNLTNTPLSAVAATIGKGSNFLAAVACLAAAGPPPG